MMEAGSMLMSGESFTTRAKLLSPRKSLEWKAQLCSTASISDQGRLEYNKRKVRREQHSLGDGLRGLECGESRA